MAKKEKEWTVDDLRLWACERILEALMNGRFREGVIMCIDQAYILGRRTGPVKAEKPVSKRGSSRSP